MAITYLELVNQVNSLVNEVELTSGNFAAADGFYKTAKNAINWAVTRITQQEFEWPFFHETEELVLTAGQTRYTPPADCKSIDYDTFRLTVSGRTAKLYRMDYDDYVSQCISYEYDRTKDAVPRGVFQTQDRRFGLYPTPDDSYIVIYEYFKYPQNLVDAIDTTLLPESFDRLIVDGAMIYVYRFRGEIEAADRLERDFTRSLADLRKIYINRHDTLRSTLIAQPTSRNRYV